MSVINNMLQDLERRRADIGDSSAVPRHVRVLPPAHKPSIWVRLSKVAVAVACTGAIGWYAYQTSALHLQPTSSAAPAAAAAVSNVAITPRAEPPRDASSIARSAGQTVPAPIPTTAVISADVHTVSSSALDKSVGAEIARNVVRVATESRGTGAAGEASGATPMIFGLKMDAMLPENMIKEIPPASRKDRSSVQPAAPVSTEPAHIDRTFRELTATQLAENEYRSGANLLNQGRIAEAQERFSAALQQAPGHVGARQALFGLLLQAKKTVEAEQVLQVALKLNPAQPGFAMAVARIQVDRGDTVAAVETLQSAVHVSQANPDYLAFLAALLQREGRHAQAIEYYQSALALAPRSGLWLMGAGISLQALGRNTDAREVYRRARAADGLSGELLAFVDQRLKQLQ